MAQPRIRQKQGSGWYLESMRHSNARKFGHAGGSYASAEEKMLAGARGIIRAEVVKKGQKKEKLEMGKYTGLPINKLSKEEFKRAFPEWQHGREAPPGFEWEPKAEGEIEWVPSQRVWWEGIEKGLPESETTKMVRPEVFRRAAFREGGVVRHMEYYVPQKFRPKKTKARQSSISPEERERQEKFRNWYKSLGEKAKKKDKGEFPQL